ncbi:MAG TPA: hypothetical protein PK156_49395, partial [Polyangium sp.]|nr:hypothetical protein [Polyangium sp.]
MFGRAIDYRLVTFVVLSIATHLVVVVFGDELYTRSSRNVVAWANKGFTRPLFDDALEVDLPIVGTETIDGKLIETPPIVIPRGGGEAIPRPDTEGAGQGGAEAAPTAENLADRQDDRTLVTAIPNRFDRSQAQRIDSGRERASREDWRASREPMELTFLASGRTARRQERRQYAVYEPSMGARATQRAAHSGGALGAPPSPIGVTEPPRREGGSVAGAEEATLGAGVRDGAPGADARMGAPVPLARPQVTTSTPSIPAEEKDKPQDKVDSAQEVAPAPQSIVHASTPGGATGEGKGGVPGGPTTPSFGGQTGAGSDARPNGDGRGPDWDQLARDARRNDYMRRVVGKIRPYFTKDLFPRWARAEGRGGTAIISFVIQRDGS